MASPLRARAALVATGILIASPAAAEDPPPPPPQGNAQQTPPPPPAPPPGAKAAPRRKAPPPPPPRPKRGKRGERDVAPPEGVPVASFPGFSRLDDGSTRIWLEVSSKVDVAENKAHGRVVYRLKGTYVMQRTNQLPLLTGFFATQVERVQLVQAGPDVELTIELREDSQFVHRVVDTPRGIVLQVDFPPVAPPDHDKGEKPRQKRTNESRTLRNDQDKNDPPPPSLDQ